MDKTVDKKSPALVMGLMSGTSIDGVDACVARFWETDGHVHYEIVATASQEMPTELRKRLLKCMAEQTIHLEELCALNVAVGELFAKTALNCLTQHQISPTDVTAIGSHGQTIYHWPPHQAGQLGGTLQIGEPSIIAEQTGILTIADFRPRDMAAGGHGAPLVCYADWVLLQHDTLGRAIQNIGGIANVTVVPSRVVQAEKPLPVIAFDTGPGNMLMDAAMSHYYDQPYDRDGQIAASGQVHSSLLNAVLAHPYLSQTPPKTTGREQFGERFFVQLQAEFSDILPQDWVSTLNMATARSIVEAYQRFVFPNYQIGEMIVGGGGAHNPVLMSRIQDLLNQNGQSIALKTHAHFGIPDQYKEALAFALLAWKNWLQEPNNLPDCTGAAHPVILGKQIFP